VIVCRSKDHITQDASLAAKLIFNLLKLQAKILRVLVELALDARLVSIRELRAARQNVIHTLRIQRIRGYTVLKVGESNLILTVVKVASVARKRQSFADSSTVPMRPMSCAFIPSSKHFF
jgi:hypothetical protein